MNGRWQWREQEPYFSPRGILEAALILIAVGWIVWLIAP